jgi:hypothetical protein
MRMTPTQQKAMLSLFSAAQDAVSEERKIWDEQPITEDNRPPDWLNTLEQRLAEARSLSPLGDIATVHEPV